MNLQLSASESGADALIVRVHPIHAGDIWLWYFWTETVSRFARQYLPLANIRIDRLQVLSQGELSQWQTGMKT